VLPRAMFALGALTVFLVLPASKFVASSLRRHRGLGIALAAPSGSSPACRTADDRGEEAAETRCLLEC